MNQLIWFLTNHTSTTCLVLSSFYWSNLYYYCSSRCWAEPFRLFQSVQWSILFSFDAHFLKIRCSSAHILLARMAKLRACYLHSWLGFGRVMCYLLHEHIILFFKQQRHNLIFHKTKINTIIIYICGTKQWYWCILDNKYNSNNINIMMIRCCFESFGVPLPKQSYIQRQRQTLTNITPSSSSSRHCY